MVLTPVMVLWLIVPDQKFDTLVHVGFWVLDLTTVLEQAQQSHQRNA
jgi:hypothetical protein|eukprot:COSAG01_NODE_18526_length_1070_cov_1.225541_1_plen_47_part_00